MLHYKAACAAGVSIKDSLVLETYSEYIHLFLSKKGLSNRPCPGEHHFVSAYLVPKLFSINQRIPDYINPDGTKGIIGDVVYYKDHEHQFGIEVKLGIIRLTKGEFNEWIVNTDETKWPHTFIGIGTKGIAMCSWKEFRNAYIKSVREKDPKWKPETLTDGYGPMKSVNVLLSILPLSKCHLLGVDVEDYKRKESIFLEALEREVTAKKTVLPTID